MGLFHDTCTAIVDAASGEALTGESLEAARTLLHGIDAKGNPVRLSGRKAEAALASRGWRFCGQPVPKRARFCRACGSGAPGGWVKCPSCRRWIGNDAHYCPHCNHPLHPEERVDIAGGVWDRGAGVFAQRFEAGEDERQLKEGLQIQEGTVAVFLDGGKETRVLGPGRHTVEGSLRAINWFGNPPPRSVVLVADGDMVFRIAFSGLRTAEELSVDATAEATIRFMPSKAADFLANFLKERRTVSCDAVCEWLGAEGWSAVKDFCLQSTVEDLVKDPERRPRFEEALSRGLRDLLARNGLDLVRVGAVEFDSPDYEQVRGKYAQLDAARRALEFKKANLALIASEEETDLADAKARDERTLADGRDRASRDAEDAEFHAKKEQEVSEFLAQLAQEKELVGIERSEEAQLALRAASGRLARKDAELEAASRLERDARETETLAHKLGLDLQLRTYTRDSLLKDAEAAAAVEAVKRDDREKEARSRAVIAGIAADVYVKQSEAAGLGYEKYAEHVAAGQKALNDAQTAHLRDLMELRARNAEIKAKADVDRAAAVKGLSALELAALHEGDAAAQAAFLEQEKIKTLAGLTQEQMLAMQAGASQAAAWAYAQEATAKANETERVLEEVRRHKDELRTDLNAERIHDERVLGASAAVAAKAAERPVPPPPPPTQQIFK